MWASPGGSSAGLSRPFPRVGKDSITKTLHRFCATAWCVSDRVSAGAGRSPQDLPSPRHAEPVLAQTPACKGLELPALQQEGGCNGGAVRSQEPLAASDPNPAAAASGPCCIGGNAVSLQTNDVAPDLRQGQGQQHLAQGAGPLSGEELTAHCALDCGTR